MVENENIMKNKSNSFPIWKVDITFPTLGIVQFTNSGIAILIYIPRAGNNFLA